MSGVKVSLGETEIGCKKEWSHVETKRFTIHNFADMTEVRGEAFYTPRWKAHGLDWKLKVFPRGGNTSNKWVEYVSCYLTLQDREKSVKTKFTISPCAGRLMSFDFMYPRNGAKSYGRRHFLKRSKVLDPSKSYIVDGALILDVEIQILIAAPTYVWKPKDRVNDSFLSDLWETRDNTDVDFLVDGNTISAHKVVLQKQASQLLEFALEAESSDSIVTIDDVPYERFKAVLCYLYTGNLPDDIMSDAEVAKVVMNVADRFGCVDLKLKIEYQLATTQVTPSSVVDWFMFADAQSCALLKEAAMRAFRKSPQEVIDSDGWAILKESPDLLTELMSTLIPSSNDPEEPESVEKRNVSELRKRLESNGLDLDGSRETLIKRLKCINKIDGATLSA